MTGIDITLFIFAFESTACSVPTGAGISIIVPADIAGEFISGTASLLFTVGATGTSGGVAAVACADSVATAVSFFSFFFLPVTIKIIRAINNNKTPPVINNPGIDKNQSRLKFI